MQVKVLFFGQLKEITGRTEEEVQVEEGSDLERLFERYAGQFPRLAAMREAVALARNREFAERSALLNDGDEIAFLPPVSGGSDGATGNAGAGGAVAEYVAIVREPIDTRALVTRLQRGEDGAVVIFEGVVRNHSGKKTTRYLEYEAYEPMALAQMRALAREARGSWPIDRIGIVHRLGRLDIGEISVAIVVTSAHRAPAFQACRHTIDRLKKTVPIWKREHFADGAVWVEGEWDEALAERRCEPSPPPAAGAQAPRRQPRP